LTAQYFSKISTRNGSACPLVMAAAAGLLLVLVELIEGAPDQKPTKPTAVSGTSASSGRAVSEPS